MVYACVMEQRKYFNVEADSEEQMLDWLATHSFFDVDCKTKNADDEYSERILDWADDNDRLKVDFSIATENADSELKNESEDEFMTDSMERLKTLIAESNRVMDDVVAETNRMKNEHAINLTNKYKAFCEKIKEYAEVVRAAKCEKQIPVNTDSEFTFKFSSLDDNEIFIKNGDSTIGWVNLTKPLDEAVYSRNSELRKSALLYIMDHLDTEVFENGIAQAVSDTLAERAAKADSDYRNAKEILSKD